MNQRTRWMPAEDEQMLALRDAELTTIEIGRRMGRSAKAVQGRLRRLAEREEKPLLEFVARMGFLTGYEITWRVWPFCSECGKWFKDGDNLRQVQPTRGPQPYYRHTECGLADKG